MAHQEGPEAASDAARQLLGDAFGKAPETLRSRARQAAPQAAQRKTETPQPAVKPNKAPVAQKPRITDWASI